MEGGGGMEKLRLKLTSAKVEADIGNNYCHTRSNLEI